MDIPANKTGSDSGRSYTIAVDFDGTIVEQRYPSIGKEKPFAVEVLKQLAEDGHRLILWTVRTGDLLEDALDWCGKRGLKFYAVNSNYPPDTLFADNRSDSPKIVADIFIDDSNLGGLPGWTEIYSMIADRQSVREKKEKHRFRLLRFHKRH